MAEAKIIDGKAFAEGLRNRVADQVRELKENHNLTPGLAVVLVGEDAASQIYVRNKEKSANEVGLKSEVIKYSDIVEEKIINFFIKNSLICGIECYICTPKF